MANVFILLLDPPLASSALSFGCPPGACLAISCAPGASAASAVVVVVVGRYVVIHLIQEGRIILKRYNVIARDSPVQQVQLAAALASI